MLKIISRIYDNYSYQIIDKDYFFLDNGIVDRTWRFGNSLKQISHRFPAPSSPQNPKTGVWSNHENNKNF